MSLARTEAALTALCVDCLPGVNCEPGPGEFDGEYLQSLLGDLPAVRLAWREGDIEGSSVVNIDSRWSVYVVTGWRGGTSLTRRIGVGAAYAILETIVPLLHGARLSDAEGALPTVRVSKVSNLWSGQQNAVGIAIYEIDLMTPDQLDIPLDKQSPFHDWLRTAATFDLPGVGHEFDPDTDEIGIAGDLASTFSMPQR